jgi:phosphopantothenoylcysteine decarboxylase / phosphopantothenate---cysteine ligase
VIVLAANLAVDAPYGIETIPTPTAESMRDAALALPDVDVLLLAAAVADYRPAEALAGKRAKDDQGWTLELQPTDDIAKALGERKRAGQVLVAFGAEHGEEGLERKRAMLETKNADLVVFNDVGRPDIGFDSSDNEVVLISRDRERAVPKASKAAVAAAILDEVERLLQ